MTKQKIAAFLIFIAHKPPKTSWLRYVVPDVSIGIAPDRGLIEGCELAMCRIALVQGSSTRGPRADCGPRVIFVWPGKGLSQITMRYEY